MYKKVTVVSEINTLSKSKQKQYIVSQANLAVELLNSLLSEAIFSPIPDKAYKKTETLLTHFEGLIGKLRDYHIRIQDEYALIPLLFDSDTQKREKMTQYADNLVAKLETAMIQHNFLSRVDNLIEDLNVGLPYRQSLPTVTKAIKDGYSFEQPPFVSVEDVYYAVRALHFRVGATVMDANLEDMGLVLPVVDRDMPIDEAFPLMEDYLRALHLALKPIGKARRDWRQEDYGTVDELNKIGRAHV